MYRLCKPDHQHDKHALVPLRLLPSPCRRPCTAASHTASSQSFIGAVICVGHERFLRELASPTARLYALPASLLLKTWGYVDVCREPRDWDNADVAFAVQLQGEGTAASISGKTTMVVAGTLSGSSLLYSVQYVVAMQPLKSIDQVHALI